MVAGEHLNSLNWLIRPCLGIIEVLLDAQLEGLRGPKLVVSLNMCSDTTEKCVHIFMRVT